VHLEDHLLAVEDHGRHARRAGVCAQERSRLLGDALSVAREVEALDVLPAGLGARAAVRARIASDLDAALADGERVDPSSALDELLGDVCSFGRLERTLLLLGADGRLGDLDVHVAHRALGPEAQLDLLGERHVHRVALRGAPVVASRDGDRRELDAAAALTARARPSERDRALRCGTSAFGGEPAVAGESPGAVDEDAYADSLRLPVRDRLDLAVLRRDVLGAPRDRACVGITRAHGGGCVDRLSTEFPHGRA
jgi:hypothetical protein